MFCDKKIFSYPVNWNPLKDLREHCIHIILQRDNASLLGYICNEIQLKLFFQSSRMLFWKYFNNKR